LRKFIEDNQIENIIFISGDLHIGAIDNGIASGFPEMTVPPASYFWSQTYITPGIWSEGIYGKFFDLNTWGYGVVTVSTNPDKVLLEVKDEHGNVRVAYELYDQLTGEALGLDGYTNFMTTVQPTPLPSTLSFFTLSLLGLGALGWRRRRR